MIREIEVCLARLINDCEEPTLREAMAYAALGPGKRIRPRLFLAACESVMGSYDEVGMQFACCLELIHAYSLAHDDLPAMDNDDLRRGQPTVHKKYNEATAILAGDALLNLAFEVMARVCSSHFHLHRPALTMSVIAEAAGSNGMIGGQMRDLAAEGKELDLLALDGIHRRKTGALFAAAMEAGATLSGADFKLTKKMGAMGRKLGLIFQIRDDILDETANAQTIGKNPGSDKHNRKSTYVSLLGLERAQEIYTQLCSEILEEMQTLPNKTFSLLELTTHIIAREK